MLLPIIYRLPHLYEIKSHDHLHSISYITDRVLKYWRENSCKFRIFLLFLLLYYTKLSREVFLNEYFRFNIHK